MNVRTHGELAGFIWRICDLLRGPYKRNKYRKVILPLTVLRRFDCLLAPTKAAVLAADDEYRGRDESVRRVLLERAAGRSFYNTAKLDFSTLLDDPNQLAQNLAGYIAGFGEPGSGKATPAQRMMFTSPPRSSQLSAPSAR